MSAISDDGIYALRSEVATEAVDDELIVLDLVRNRYAGLNSVGATVFSLLDGVRPLSQIIETIAEAYDVALDQAREDIFAFVDEALRAELIQQIS